MACKLGSTDRRDVKQRRPSREDSPDVNPCSGLDLDLHGGLRRWPRRLLERFPLLTAEHRGRDFQLEDLVRPLVDAANAHVLQMSPRPVQRGPAAAAIDL